MKILVTGSRHWRDQALLHDVLSLWTSAATHLVHGGARGADAAAHDFARQNGWTVHQHYADWDRYGRAAGVIRNQTMLDLHPDIDLILAFPTATSIGTWDMVRRARAKNIPRLIIKE